VKEKKGKNSKTDERIRVSKPGAAELFNRRAL